MYKVSDGIRSAKNQDGMTILDIPRGRVLRLNTTASLIFQWLQQGHSESRIIEEISRKFCISHEVAESDVGELLKSLEQTGLLHGDSSTGRL